MPHTRGDAPKDLLQLVVQGVCGRAGHELADLPGSESEPQRDQKARQGAQEQANPVAERLVLTSQNEIGKRFVLVSSKEIKDKVAFCQKAVEAMRTESWSLMPEAEKVCEQIYSFVCEASDAQQQT